MKLNKRLLMIGMVGSALIVAGLADMKYQGLLYQKLPKSVQARLDRMMAP